MTTADPQGARNETGAAADEQRKPVREPLIVNPHRKLPVWLWVIPLVIIVAAIVMLPHILERFI